MHARPRIALALALVAGASFGCKASGADDGGTTPCRDCEDAGSEPEDSGATPADAGDDAAATPDAAAPDAGPDAASDSGTPDGGPDGTVGPTDSGTDAHAIVCGDDVVEGDETCEPGLDACCNDTCDGPRASSHVCRPATGDCDLAETCDGTALACPSDTHVAGSASCGDSSDSECDDPDTCDGDGTCLGNEVGQGTACTDTDTTDCDVAECDGAGSCVQDHAVEDALTPCGDTVTDTTCNAADRCDASGNCLARLASAGTQCNDTNTADCLDAQCNGSGTCVQSYTLEAALTPCGSPTDDDCTDPDTCTADGVCHPRDVGAGTQCTDFLTSDCDDARCDGLGACDQDYAFEPPLTPCGDTVTDTICDAADSCDAAGNCDDRLAGAGTDCTDLTPVPTGDCNDARCDGTGACVQDYELQPVDTACGNQTDTTCNAADKCDASGTCLPRLTSAGTLCTDTTTTDCYSPACNGSGTCNQTYALKAPGTSCSSETPTECDTQNTCDAGGACLDNVADEYTQCSDGDPDDCYDALCDGAGACMQAYDLELDGTLCDQGRGNCWADACCPGMTVDADADGLCDFADAEDDVVFATSTSPTGSLGGLAGADATCNARAASAGLEGTFVAWLSSSGSDAIDRVGDGPFVRIDGTVVADDVADLTNGSLDASISRDELNHTRNTNVWTGTETTGNADAGGMLCGNWASTSGLGAYGSSTATTGDWTASSDAACTTAYALYCMQVDCAGTPDVDFASDPSNCGGCGVTCPSGTCLGGQCIGTVFVTDVAYPGDLPFGAEELGEVDGDLYCNERAAAASLPGTFTAWLSTSRVDAAGRISDQRYALPSGAVVADSLADLIDGTLQHAIDEDETGASTGTVDVWTGTDASGLANAESCTDWTVGSNGANGRYGSTGATNGTWTSLGSAGCAASKRLYCFQDAPP